MNLMESVELPVILDSNELKADDGPTGTQAPGVLSHTSGVHDVLE
jgi:hypothetical protein